ncbi:hypothetical protein VC83_07349 [Pseudogymnoascus destructans]|uniref:Uncharacterized protein n=2 Tax=Pseudogymnoascus destructans TaxID=655981 RepID=L8FYS7_PSED2|nr:uncharacterized protein VC83_07349 [Pseudogymnoascus destructans]ELR06160.1 hypothetical protein GMDG_07815 [Pseudogymnoascus destructans 20631-21]OAF56220.1 hypothetical protein VC83_07349 [Pseudogymnoascus destructans]
MRHSALPPLRSTFSLASLRSSFRSSRSSTASGTRSRTPSTASASWNPHGSFAPSATSSSSASPVGDLSSLPYNPLSRHQPRTARRQQSPVATVRSILSRQSSLVDLEEEERDFGTEIGVLEPRPAVFWQGLEERMGL